ncbi:hypothetical protein E1A91_D11G082900v1 [Gossypium mustelinum]|uniref:Uncharacterized protein n=1 Tax=Gossypium mustelinum TaxID=34275 RepID=A0A5D2SNQ1_GOSMU|nr:hypothetical protein E1A91_D11G082900v1 [Gossypium mustelinum]
MEEISDQPIFKNSWEKCRLLAKQDITLLSWLPLMKGVEEAIMFLINILMEAPIGKVVCMGRKMKEMVMGSFSSFISNFYKSKTLKIAQEAQVSDSKSTNQEKGRGWVCLVLFVLLTTGPKGVRCEDIGNPLVPGSTAMDSFLANKYLRGGARHLAAAIDYKVLSHGYRRSNTSGREKVNPYDRPHNPEDRYRQGNTGKH